MTDNRTRLRRLLILEAFLGATSIILASWLYFHALDQQQRIAQLLFQHPFAVSNAALEFRADVLDIRKYVLEQILSPEPVAEIQLGKIKHLEEKMDRDLAIIRQKFLGDQDRVSNIVLELSSWKPIREAVKSNLLAGKVTAAENIATQQASPHIEQILVDTDYVISFARERALRFVEEGRAQLNQSRLMTILLVLLLLGGYLSLTFKLRQGIYRVYDQEEHAATFDSLTGVYNRRSFFQRGEAELKRAKRHNHPLSLLMLDLDHFKNINDSHGHDAGDCVLRQVKALCRQHLREEDLTGRIGGEEFAILLAETNRRGAVEVAERIRQEFAVWEFKEAAKEYLKVTVSIGVATLGDADATLDTLLKDADAALYQAKKGGRNQVATAGEG